MNTKMITEIPEDLCYSIEYAQYIMNNCGGDRLICDGDMLTIAMEELYLFEQFLEHLSRTRIA